MNWDEFNQAVSDAQFAIRRGDDAARNLARLMRNRLKVAEIDGATLAAFKRELRNFNLQTEQWIR